MLPSEFCRVYIQTANLARHCGGAKFIRMGKQANKSYDYFRDSAKLDEQRQRKISDLAWAKKQLAYWQSEVNRLS